MPSLLSRFLPARLPRFGVVMVLVLATAAGADSVQAAFPGVPGEIAYVRQMNDAESSTGGIFAHSPQRRGGSRQLTSDIYDEAPSYSADGRMIVFVGNREPGRPAGSHIYLMKADGSGVSQITSGESYDRNPSFSPDGQQVVFDRTASSQKPQIFIANVDGTGLRQLTDGASKNYDPVFAPSGKWIAFVSDRDHDVKTDRSDIFSMRFDGSRQRVLVDGPRNESEPDVSPDGRRIAFVSNRRQGEHIYVAKSNGRGAARALTHARTSCHYTACFFSPAWAPDGKHIAVLSIRRYSTELEVMRPDGTERKEFASGGTEEEGFGTHIGAPSWGPRPR